VKLTQRQKRALVELAKRRKNKPVWLTPGFDAQNKMIEDPSRLKAVQCTRRAGKTYGAVQYACKEAYENDGVSIVIIGLTRMSVKRIIYKDILKVINRNYKLGIAFNETELTATFPNGSIIYLVGVDQSPDQMDKLLGQKYKLAIIDEAAFYRQDLRKVVYEILKPATADYLGTIVLISTSSDITKGLYFDIMHGKEPGWSVHKWTAYDNPFMAEVWDQEIKEMIANDPQIVETPMFKRMYLNEWHLDTNALIYKFSDANITHTLPQLPEKGWNTVLALGVGYEEEKGFVLGQYHDFDPTLYIVDAYKHTNMDFAYASKHIKEVDQTYNLDTVLVYGAHKDFTHELSLREDLMIVGAPDNAKNDFIKLVNTDLKRGIIKLIGNTTEQLQDEWSNLIWDERKKEQNRYVEHPSCPKLLADSTLAVWRYAYNYIINRPEEKIVPHSEAAVDQWWEEQANKVQDLDNIPDWEKELDIDEDPFFM